MSTKLGWRVSTVELIREILSDPYNRALRIPLNILINLLGQVSQRATELHDPELDKLMVRLSLYSISDPKDPEYDPELISKILQEEI